MAIIYNASRAGRRRWLLPIALASLTCLVGVAVARTTSPGASSDPVAGRAPLRPTVTPEQQGTLAAVTMLLDDSARYVFQDDFETNQGWSVQNTSVSTGAFERADRYYSYRRDGEPTGRILAGIVLRPREVRRR